ncbi:hypothetical protein HDU76_004592, partial [Blyttiomyces sp. JEL0837]
SFPEPRSCFLYLGISVNLVLRSFTIPPNKRDGFLSLLRSLLDGSNSSLSSLERLAGKCAHFSLVIPGALAFTREMYLTISQTRRLWLCTSGSSSVSTLRFPMTPSLLLELWEWLMVDPMSTAPCYSSVWPSPTHVRVRTDASDHSWGGVLFSNSTTPVLSAGASFPNNLLPASCSINVHRTWVDLESSSASFISDLSLLPPPLWVDLGVDNLGLFHSLSKVSIPAVLGSVDTSHPAVDELYISSRLEALALVCSTIPSLKASTAEYNRFKDFLSRLSSPVAPLSAKPSHVVAFLINKDHTGQTQYHARGCPHAATARAGNRVLRGCDNSCTTPSTCPHADLTVAPPGCPIRVGHKSLSTTRSVLKSALAAVGLSDRWSPLAVNPNPADSPEVDEFLLLISMEAAASAVSSVQANPIFPSDLRAILALSRSELSSVTVNRHLHPRFHRLELLRFLAVCLVVSHSGRRLADILACPPNAFWWLPTRSGVLVTLFEHKTAHSSGSVQRLALSPVLSDLDLCPIAALVSFQDEARLLGLDVFSAGYAFPDISPTGFFSSRSPSVKVFSSSFAMVARVAGYPSSSLHGCRVAAGIAARLSGTSLEDLLRTAAVRTAGGWSSSSAADRYSGLAVAIQNLSSSLPREDLLELLSTWSRSYSSFRFF